MEKNQNLEKHPIFSEFESIKKPAARPGEIEEPLESEDENLQQRFLRERKDWESQIVALSKRIKDINDIAELQVDVYSARQNLVEYYHYLVSLTGRKNAEIRKKKRARLEYYQTGYDYKLDKEQTQMYIMTDLEDLYITLQELENHMKYISSSMGTVDNIIFGIKHRITLEEYKRRM